jgi:hypothetical protein
VVSNTIWKHEHGFLDKSKVEPEAMVQLDKLSKDDEWWVRLYGGEILRRHPAFRTPELLARLAADKHPLVQEAVTFTKDKANPPKPPSGQPLDAAPP